MGRKMDALLRRNFRVSKFQSLVKLAISRSAILKNQHHVRHSHARSDVVQLLNLGHHDSALIRVEYVIKEQHILDVLFMVESYCNLLLERVVLIQKNKECPDELKEAISSLIFASSRCGMFPELQQIREVFTSRFGNEFAVSAVELRNECGVNPKIFRKFSVRQPSLESRLEILKEIATENGITLQLEEYALMVAEEKLDVNESKKQPERNLDKPEDTHNLPEELDLDEKLSESVKARKKYIDALAAKLEAFESAAHAASAARAAVELSRSESQDNDPENHTGSSHHRRTISDNDGSLSDKLQSDIHAGSEEIESSNNRLEFDKTHPVDDVSSESEGEHMAQNSNIIHLKELEEQEKAGIKRTTSTSSSDSDGNNLSERNLSSNIPCQNELLGNEIVLSETDNKAGKEMGSIPSSEHHDLGSNRKSSLPTDECQITTQYFLERKLTKYYNAVDEEGILDEDGYKLFHQSPRWMPPNSKADPIINPVEGKSMLTSAHGSEFVEKLHSQHSNINGKQVPMTTEEHRL